MDQSTQKDWEHIYHEHLPHVASMPKRILSMLKQMKGLSLGFETDQYHHSLQTATMARRAGADDEMILISLIHDLGKVINVPNHGQICAEIIKPYVTSAAYNIVRTHQDFQGKHYYHFQGRPQNLREQYESEAWYERAVEFTDEWDQAAFDPDYQLDPLESFLPLIEATFGTPASLVN